MMIGFGGYLVFGLTIGAFQTCSCFFDDLLFTGY